MSGTVLLVASSLRRGSFTTALLDRFGRLLPDSLTAERIDLIRPLPYYDADLDGPNAPESVVSARAAVADATALVIATPEYNGTITGGLKNAIDWITRPHGKHVLVGKPVAVIGASPGSGGARHAVACLDQTLLHLGAELVGESLVVPNVATHIDEHGVVDDEITARLRALAAALDGVLAGTR